MKKIMIFWILLSFPLFAETTDFSESFDAYNDSLGVIKKCLLEGSDVLQKGGLEFNETSISTYYDLSGQQQMLVNIVAQSGDYLGNVISVIEADPKNGEPVMVHISFDGRKVVKEKKKVLANGYVPLQKRIDEGYSFSTSGSFACQFSNQ